MADHCAFGFGGCVLRRLDVLEHQRDLAKLKPVALVQDPRAGQRRFVHIGAVRAADVEQPEMSALEADCRMMP